MTAKEPPLVLVEWEDAYSGNHQWIETSSIPEKMQPLILRTVGFMVRDDPERITLAMSYGSSREPEPTCCDLFTIPRAVIKSQTVLG